MEPSQANEQVLQGGEVGAAGQVARPRSRPVEPVAERLAAEMRVFDQLAEQLRGRLDVRASFEDRCDQVARHATELFAVSPTWASFYREVLGCSGVARVLFPDAMSYERFEGSEQFGQLMEMLKVLRSQDLPENDPTEPQRMVTIRMPRAMYDVLCAEANAMSISVNKLCVTRIIQRLDRSLVPQAAKKRRGRKPGSAGAKVAEEA